MQFGGKMKLRPKDVLKVRLYQFCEKNKINKENGKDR